MRCIKYHAVKKMIKVYAAAAAIAISFAGGWTVRSWYGSSVELAAKTAADIVLAAEIKRESSVAAVVEAKLQGLKANERIIERYIPEIITRDIYLHECIDDDGKRIVDGLPLFPESEASPAELNGFAASEIAGIDRQDGG